MAHDGSSQKGGVQFDLRSQAGVLQVLTSIRNSELSMEDRNELRDLVFLFANGGGDKAVRETLEERLIALGVTKPVAGKADAEKGAKAVEPDKSGGFVTSRPTPTFGAHSKPKPVPVATVPTAPPEPDTPMSSVSSVPTTDVASPQPVASPAPVSTPAPEPQTKPETATKPAPEPVVSPAAPADKQPASVPSSAPEPASVPTAAGQHTDGEQLRRIREIKADVNQRVGNPVNLVDIDNAVGREYMNALLDAMRTVSGGTPQSAQAAMEKLEKAYQNVLSVVEKNPNTEGNVKPQTPPVPPAPATTPPPEPAPKPVTPSPAPQPAPTTPPAPPTPATAPAQTTMPTSFAPHTMPAADIKAPAPQPTPAPPEPQPEEPSGWAQTLANIKLATIGDRGHKDEQDAQVVPTAPQSQPVPTAPAPQPTPAPAAPVQRVASMAPSGAQSQPPAPGLRSIAQEPPLKKPTDLPQQAPRASAGATAGDPLYAPAVDQGLNQLLSEWDLFKKSGLFGTGPKGMDHPLFVKLADLQIPLILAGRFEGATQEIKQSITDYMNGWRYEQGIVYEPGETFEHYLRRVINHILGVQS